MISRIQHKICRCVKNQENKNNNQEKNQSQGPDSEITETMGLADENVNTAIRYMLYILKDEGRTQR